MRTRQENVDSDCLFVDAPNAKREISEKQK
jgi:hypothetical protein